MHHLTAVAVAQHAAAGTQLAALTDGSALKSWILLIVGNLFAAFLGVRAFGHFLKKDWGELITMCVAAIAIAGIIWFPDQTKVLLSDVWGKVSGNA